MSDLTEDEKAVLIVNEMHFTILAKVREALGLPPEKSNIMHPMEARTATRGEIAGAIAVGIRNAIPHLLSAVAISDIDAIRTATEASIAEYETKRRKLDA